MREIVIDTETTVLDPLDGHRVVEICAVELVDHSSRRRAYDHNDVERDGTLVRASSPPAV